MNDNRDITGKISNVIPLHPLRKIIEKDCPYQISEMSIVKLRQVLEELTCLIAKNAIAEFEKLNDTREKQGLKPLKRLNEWAIFLSSQNIINHSKNIDLGVQPRRIVYPGGTKMSKDKKAAMPDNNKVEVE